MKLPDKFHQSLTLLLLATLVAYFLSPVVFSSQVNSKSDLAEILTKGSSTNEETKYSQTFLVWFLALGGGYLITKKYKYWRSAGSPFLLLPALEGRTSDKSRNKDVAHDIKKYKTVLNTMSSLEEKTAPPRFITKRRRKINRPKPAPGSIKQTKKIIYSSRSLSNFKVKP